MRYPIAIVRVLIIALSLVWLGAGCSDAPTEAECTKLLEHVLELETQAAGASATGDAKKDLAKQKKAVADSIGKEFMDTCLERLPKKQVDCGLEAKTLEELAVCDKSEG